MRLLGLEVKIYVPIRSYKGLNYESPFSLIKSKIKITDEKENYLYVCVLFNSSITISNNKH